MDKLVLPAAMDNMGAFQQFVTSRLEEAGGEMPLCLRIEMVLEELLTNIMYYAYADTAGDIELECSAKDGMLRIRITDTGIAFNMLNKKDPDTTLSVDERQIGGLGIFLVKEVMDEVRYERKDDKNILYLELSV